MLTKTSLLQSRQIKAEDFDALSIQNESEFDRFSDNDEEKTQVTQEQPMRRLAKEFRIQLIAEKNILRKDRRNKRTSQIYPLNSEIQDAFKAICQKFPDKDIFKIAKQLYEHLIPQNLLKCKKAIENPKETEEEIKEKLYQNNPISKVERNIHAIECLSNYVGFKKIFLESSWRAPTDFPNSHQAMLFRMKRYAAKSFVTHGHSLNYFRKEVFGKEEPDTYKSRYYPSLICVTTDAYKFLECFILDDCQIKIEKHPREVFKRLFYALIHCRKAFKNDECEVFLNIIKVVYGLGDVTLDEYSTVRLYLVMQKKLRMSILKKLGDESKPGEAHTPMATNSQETRNILYQKTLANSSIVDTQNIWTFELEQELIAVYKRIQHFRDIKKHFRQKYPQLKKFLEGPGLRNRLNQIVRITLRRVQEIAEKNSDVAIALAPITKTGDNSISYVVQAARCLKARLMLTDIYVAKIKTYTPQIEAVIREINEAIEERHRYKLRDLYVRKYEKAEASKRKQKEAKDDDTLSTLSFGSKCYAPTRAKDWISVIPLNENARKPAYLSHFYYKEQGKFIGYARYNDESQKDTFSEIGSEVSSNYRIEKNGENEDYDSDFYYGEQ